MNPRLNSAHSRLTATIPPFVFLLLVGTWHGHLPGLWTEHHGVSYPPLLPPTSNRVPKLHGSGLQHAIISCCSTTCWGVFLPSVIPHTVTSSLKFFNWPHLSPCVSVTSTSLPKEQIFLLILSAQLHTGIEKTNECLSNGCINEWTKNQLGDGNGGSTIRRVQHSVARVLYQASAALWESIGRTLKASLMAPTSRNQPLQSKLLTRVFSTGTCLWFKPHYFLWNIRVASAARHQ